MYNNETAGPAFEEFLDLLGQRVRLKGFTKYRAQLDTKSKLRASVCEVRPQRWAHMHVCSWPQEWPTELLGSVWVSSGEQGLISQWVSVTLHARQLVLL